MTQWPDAHLCPTTLPSSVCTLGWQLTIRVYRLDVTGVGEMFNNTNVCTYRQCRRSKRGQKVASSSFCLALILISARWPASSSAQCNRTRKPTSQTFKSSYSILSHSCSCLRWSSVFRVFQSYLLDSPSVTCYTKFPCNITSLTGLAR